MTQDRNEQIALMLGYVNTTPTDKDFKIFEFPTKVGCIPRMIETMSMQFHLDWNWLMEAVEFIERRGYGYVVEISGNPEKQFCAITKINSDHSIVRVGYSDEVFTKKESVFIAVSDFAKLYNNKEL